MNQQPISVGPWGIFNPFLSNTGKRYKQHKKTDLINKKVNIHVLYYLL